MPHLIIYLLKCQICLAIVWLFYQLLLRRLTFYTMNRWYLLGYAYLSFLLPLVHIVLPQEGTDTGTDQVISYIPVIIGRPAVKEKAAVFTGWDILLCALALGALYLAARLLIRWLSLRRIGREATLLQGIVQDEAVMVYQVDKPIIPFSFGKAIYINPGLHTAKELEEIVLHEYVHVRQRHTVDILLAELICIINWWAPFSWLLRHTIRQNLEFIADQQVLASGLDRKSYQYHLLKVAGEPVYRLANNFNFSSLKKRIVMMNRSKSARLHLVKFLFIVPLLGALLVAFRDKVDVRMSVSLPAVAGPAHVPGDTTPINNLITSPWMKMSAPPPMMVLDEEESTKEKVDKVNPDEIATVSVLKKAPEFGSRGANGVVLIYRKNYQITGFVTLKDGTTVNMEHVMRNRGPRPPAEKKNTDEITVMGYASPRQTTGGEVTVRDTAKPGVDVKSRDTTDLHKCLFILDGKVSSYEEVFKLPPASIASINVIKGKDAEAIYGSRAKDGVIMVATKGPGFKGQPTITSMEKGDTMTIRADTIQMKPR